ncbi:VOC family protein [Bowmanella dokdonensis]|uniref:VOC family protein n=1 Tax=Bowmanella dokdonensis TaxID=751969 RepID=A0A939DKK3_9ALTE|nr:VOC family protein [Bowmanella dokdonensis]MBN7824198.1 VOC family protein [Bowmanella dokdonensis]
MLRLEHLNLVVRDIPTALKFYRAAFPHWKIRGEGVADWYGTRRNWLHFGDDYNYLTFNDNGSGENRDLKSNSLGLAHFAYVVEDLDRLIDRMAGSGFTPAKQGSIDPHRRNIYFVDPDGFEVEFVQYLSDIPAQRNLYG